MNRKENTSDVRTFRCLAFPLIGLFALICLIPFLLIIASSLTSESSIIRYGYNLWPREFSTEAYGIVFRNPARILNAYGVTIFVTVVGTLLSVFINTMTGYVLSRRDFRWRNIFSFYFFFTTLFSGGLVPWYILCVKTLRLKNTVWAMIIPVLVSVWNILLVKGFMNGLPFEIIESAKIDGAGDFLIFRKIIFPLSTPVVATIAMFTALQYWNDWYMCMLFIDTKNLYSLQYMSFWPDYWMGLPPFHYGTHAISPLLALTGRQARRVHCLGSGTMDKVLVKNYNNPYPIETALFDLGGGLSAEVTRSLFETAVLYSESFNVYGEKKTFEWQQIEEEEKPVVLTMGGKNYDENGVLWRGQKVVWERETLPDHSEILPPEIRRFTVKSKFYDKTNPQNSFEAGGGHGGAHPYMVHEFVSSILENRRPWIDEIRAAQWNAPGLCAHESALRHGEGVDIPQYE